MDSQFGAAPEADLANPVRIRFARPQGLSPPPGEERGLRRKSCVGLALGQRRRSSPRSFSGLRQRALPAPYPRGAAMSNAAPRRACSLEQVATAALTEVS